MRWRSGSQQYSEGTTPASSRGRRAAWRSAALPAGYRRRSGRTLIGGRARAFLRRFEAKTAARIGDGRSRADGSSNADPAAGDLADDFSGRYAERRPHASAERRANADAERRAQRDAERRSDETPDARSEEVRGARDEPGAHVNAAHPAGTPGTHGSSRARRTHCDAHTPNANAGSPRRTGTAGRTRGDNRDDQ